MNRLGVLSAALTLVLVALLFSQQWIQRDTGVGLAPMTAVPRRPAHNVSQGEIRVCPVRIWLRACRIASNCSHRAKCAMRAAPLTPAADFTVLYPQADRPLLRGFDDVFAASEFRPVYIVHEPQNDLFDKETRSRFEKLNRKALSKKDIAVAQLTQHRQRRACTMADCFDYSRCNTMSIYVYPTASGEKQTLFFRTMLKYFRGSAHITSDPARACLFIPSIDTSDRDPLSPDFVPDAPQRLKALPYWNGGRNHLLFNTFPGSYPDYYEYMDFDTDYAIQVKSCLTLRSHRQNFDISFPHYKPDSVLPKVIPPNSLSKRFLATFKGKRYLYGVGKEVREDLRAVDNAHDLVVLTTCVHLSDWERFADSQCKADNMRYGEFEYDYLLKSSLFSYVPRGRRINTFRLLEVIAAGSIPIVLSDDMLMPFQELIEWDGAAVVMPEGLVVQSAAILRQYSRDDIQLMQNRLRYIWDTRLATFDRALDAVVQIMHDRIFPRQRHSIEFWNGPFPIHGSQPTWFRRERPVALTDAAMAALPAQFPRSEFAAYTVVVLVHNRFDVMFDVFRDSLARTMRIDKVIVVMNDPGSTEPPRSEWPPMYFPIEVYRIKKNSLNNRFLPIPSINTEAVLALDDDLFLDPFEIEFGFEVWRKNQDVIVGWPARRHVWEGGRWTYNSEFSSSYSMVLTGAAFYHRRYNELYSYYMQDEIFDMVHKQLNCEDIAFNYMVADHTRKPPIKATGRWTFPCKKCAERKLSTHNAKGLTGHLHSRSDCMQHSAEVYGYQPLITTTFRADPVIYDGKTALKLRQQNAFPVPEPA